MSRSCVVLKCPNKLSKSRPDVNFFHFPFSRRKVLQKWIKAMCCKDWYPAITKTSSICSDHFLPEDFMLPAPGMPTRLKPTAVPSQFNFALGISKKVKKQSMDHQKKRQPIHKVTDVEIVSEEDEKVDGDTTSSSVKKLEKNLIGTASDSDNSSCDTNDSESLSSEEILKRKLEIMTALYEKTQKKLKLCQEQCKLYVKQVIALEEVIDNLRQINSASDLS